MPACRAGTLDFPGPRSVTSSRIIVPGLEVLRSSARRNHGNNKLRAPDHKGAETLLPGLFTRPSRVGCDSRATAVHIVYILRDARGKRQRKLARARKDTRGRFLCNEDGVRAAGEGGKEGKKRKEKTKSDCGARCA